ncbi:MAG: hypothetical protein QXJ28_01065, partial [Candidatus Pacearchaeota archaeon]
IENCGKNLPKEITFELFNLPKGIEIKEPLFTVIPKLNYANSERFLLYHIRVKENAIPGEYVIKTKLSYGNEYAKTIKEGEIVFGVKGDKSELNIASVKLNPVIPYRNDKVELTIRIENTGKGTAKSIKVYANHNFKGTKESFIGSLRSNEDGPAMFTFIADKEGEFKIPIEISYKDDFGENRIDTAITLSILEREMNKAAIVGITLTLVAFIFLILKFISMKKSKDRIIHQLLKNPESNIKSKEK